MLQTTQNTFALPPPHSYNIPPPTPTDARPTPLERSSIAPLEPPLRPMLLAVVDEPAPSYRQSSPVSYPARRYIHSPRSQSLPTIPSLEELASDDDTSFTSSTHTSETSQSLSTASSESGSTGALNERILPLSPDDEEFDYIATKSRLLIRPTTPLPSPQCPDRGGRRHRSFDEFSFKNVIYSTNVPPYDPFAVNQTADEEMDSIENLREIPDEEPLDVGTSVTSIPFAGLADDEEWHSIDTSINASGDLSAEHAEECIVQHARSEILNWAYSVSAPVFFPEPLFSGRRLIPAPTIDLDDHVECLGHIGIEETIPHFRIKRKSVPEAPKSLADISREVLLRQINSHKPVTTSLLTLHEDMMPWQRLRTHLERTHRGRVAPDGDSLRRDTLQRNAHQLVPSPLLTPVSAECNLEPDLKPQLFPRAGDLLRLHRADSTSLIDDWHLRT
jgi:hypothetical protein